MRKTRRRVETRILATQIVRQRRVMGMEECMPMWRQLSLKSGRGLQKATKTWEGQSHPRQKELVENK